MQPNENIVLLAAQSNTYSGSVVSNAVAPGCKFMFSARNREYDLQIVPGTYDIISSSGSGPVDPVPTGQSLIQLLNK